MFERKTKIVHGRGPSSIGIFVAPLMFAGLQQDNDESYVGVFALWVFGIPEVKIGWNLGG